MNINKHLGFGFLGSCQLRSSAAGGLEVQSQKQVASPSSPKATAELRLALSLPVPDQAASAAATLQACLALCLTNPYQDFGPQDDFHDFPCESGRCWLLSLDLTLSLLKGVPFWQGLGSVVVSCNDQAVADSHHHPCPIPACLAEG